ncbi:MAG: biotin/lipoate A/B protein ligase family protein [Chloroflexota bacterium]
MNSIRLLDLGVVPPVRSQTIYHAVAYALDEDSPDTIILVAPTEPYVCIGFHQDLDKEVDAEYCRAHGLPVYRREVGGGAVYLDRNQVFAQWVFHRANLPADIGERFALYVKPLIQTYQALGIAAQYRPINDVHVQGKKIGGTGAAQMGDAEVVVGSLMFDFNTQLMSQVLKVASEKMRDKVFQSLNDYMTTMTKQLGYTPDRDKVVKLYIEQCEQVLGHPSVRGVPTTKELALAEELDRKFSTNEWLYQKGDLRQVGVKIHEDVRVAEAVYKAQGGLIRVTARLRERQIEDLSLSGDFTMLPKSAVGALESALCDTPLNSDEVRARIIAVYRTIAIQSPGVTVGDLANAVLLLK